MEKTYTIFNAAKACCLTDTYTVVLILQVIRLSILWSKQKHIWISEPKMAFKVTYLEVERCDLACQTRVVLKASGSRLRWVHTATEKLAHLDFPFSLRGITSEVHGHSGRVAVIVSHFNIHCNKEIKMLLKYQTGIKVNQLTVLSSQGATNDRNGLARCNL